ncbi:MAG: hypothetical protein ACI837_001186 [Crocinitomicaceae bacterium]|jgi:hypothetical protein
MESNKFIIEQNGLNKYESKDMLIKLINGQINSCKLDHMSNWERNHSITSEALNKKVEALQAKRSEIEAFFETSKTKHQTIDMCLSIELKVIENAPQFAHA